jgi:hypothetical protein
VGLPRSVSLLAASLKAVDAAVASTRTLAKLQTRRAPRGPDRAVVVVRRRPGSSRELRDERRMMRSGCPGVRSARHAIMEDGTSAARGALDPCGRTWWPRCEQHDWRTRRVGRVTAGRGVVGTPYN